MLAREVPRDQLIAALDEFSRQHEGWIATVEIVGLAVGDQEQIAGLPLVGISADGRDRETPIAIIVRRDEVHVTHIVSRPQRVWIKQPEQVASEALAIEADDGTTTIVHFHIAAAAGGLQLTGW
jgi:hypothetical protein